MIYQLSQFIQYIYLQKRSLLNGSVALGSIFDVNILDNFKMVQDLNYDGRALQTSGSIFKLRLGP